MCIAEHESGRGKKKKKQTSQRMRAHTAYSPIDEYRAPPHGCLASPYFINIAPPFAFGALGNHHTRAIRAPLQAAAEGQVDLRALTKTLYCGL